MNSSVSRCIINVVENRRNYFNFTFSFGCNDCWYGWNEAQNNVESLQDKDYFSFYSRDYAWLSCFAFAMAKCWKFYGRRSSATPPHEKLVYRIVGSSCDLSSSQWRPNFNSTLIIVITSHITIDKHITSTIVINIH